MKTIIFIVILLGLFLIINYMYKKTNYYKNSIKQLEKYLKGVPVDLEIVNTGSSYARYAFDYSYTDLKGFNFGLQPQSLSYDFRILKQYTPNLREDCTVLIVLPDLVFGFLDYENDNSNTKYYHFLEPKRILGYNKLKYISRVKFPMLSAKKNILRLIKDVKSGSSYDQDENLMLEEEVYKDAVSRVEGWKKEFKLENTVDGKSAKELESIFEDTRELLKEMIEYCLDKGFKPAIVVPPTSSIINDLLSKEFIKTVLYDNIEKANIREIPVLDYLYDERFQDYELYINSDMLNKTGREKFTEVVLNDIRRLGLYGGQ